VISPRRRSFTLYRIAGLALAASACAASDRDTALADTTELSVSGTSDSTARRVGVLDGFYGPESVKYDADGDVWFISNMLGPGSDRDGAGFIDRVDAGELKTPVRFIESGKNGAVLDAPKGMAIHGDTLWVTDIDRVRGFDRRSGKPLATIDLSGHDAVMLNDIAVGPDGSLYITDTGIIMSAKGVLHPGGDKIFIVGPGRAVSLLASGEELGRPNGITWDAAASRWVIVSFDPFRSEVYTFAAGDTGRTVLLSGKGKFDGVEALADGSLIFTCWNDSSLHHFANGTDRLVVRNLSWPADIGVDTKRNRIAIPQVMINRVEFWELTRP
jgi:sugar lactone lactonase YvrE